MRTPGMFFINMFRDFSFSFEFDKIFLRAVLSSIKMSNIDY